MDQASLDSRDRLTQCATRIGVLLKFEANGPSCRVLIDSAADLVLDEMIVGYIEEEMGLQMVVDPTPCHDAWRRLEIIVGDRKLKKGREC